MLTNEVHFFSNKVVYKNRFNLVKIINNRKQNKTKMIRIEVVLFCK